VAVDTSFSKKRKTSLACWLCGLYTVQKNRYKFFMKPGTPPLQSARLLDQVRERVRYMHYSLKTEKAYIYWVRFFVRWSAAQPGGMRHPRDMGAQDVEAFLSMMANERKVSASTHNQALSAVLFLYREVLNIDLPWLNNIGRPHQTKRIPSVLTKDEVAGLLAQMEGIPALLAKLLYGTGMRLMEGVRLRVKDVDFDRNAILGVSLAHVLNWPSLWRPAPASHF
jgi:site-specific recombinase XerD